MSTIKIRKCDQGTTYAAAILSGDKTGMAHCTDAEAMAGFLDSCAQILLGAVSPRLIWEGAQARGMTNLELARVIHARDLGTIDDLQFGEHAPAIRVTRETS